MYQNFNPYLPLYREDNYEYDDSLENECLDNEYRATDYSFYVGQTIAAPANTRYFSMGTPIFIQRTFGHGQNQNVEVLYQNPYGNLSIVIISAIELDGVGPISCPSQNRPTLRIGSTGSWVVELQKFLQGNGYYSGRIDGQFGSVTDRAVRNYQRNRGLLADGIVGPKTWCQLERDGFPVGPVVPPCPSQNRPTLRIGSTGYWVVKLQEFLQGNGYYSGRIDGQFGPVTDRAVRNYQRNRGLLADGIVGPKTWCQLERDGFMIQREEFCPSEDRPTLRIGSTGHWVVKLQEFLQGIGYYSGRIDGQFGPVTDGAVKNYQSDRGLLADGIVGPKTWCQLERDGFMIQREEFCPSEDRPTLRIGSTGHWVVKLQEFLQGIGYYSGRIDSQFGPVTDGAVKNYQSDRGLLANGIVGPKTWCQLEQDGFPKSPPPCPSQNRPILRIGSTGHWVVKLQEFLQGIGYYSGRIDGQFGPVTGGAVKNYQSNRGLLADGIVGPKTWCQLEQDGFK
ncbi:peptidoglycan-binding domain-containing protein [Bacillus cereus]|uniref:peptidoglycan-binding domain-containing protein n=1 Tax=Bacillus cereus TaxID=1396 RepID=UPI0018795430|nr:peptidoglycan-binding protein [Bacillus cereus]MBE7099710.1 peptidoglycan-binding protein [Bacillus cereus]